MEVSIGIEPMSWLVCSELPCHLATRPLPAPLELEADIRPTRREFDSVRGAARGELQALFGTARPGLAGAATVRTRFLAPGPEVASASESATGRAVDAGVERSAEWHETKPPSLRCFVGFLDRGWDSAVRRPTRESVLEDSVQDVRQTELPIGPVIDDDAVAVPVRSNFIATLPRSEEIATLFVFAGEALCLAGGANAFFEHAHRGLEVLALMTIGGFC